MSITREADELAAGQPPRPAVRINDDDILKQFNKRLSDARTHQREWRRETHELYEMIAGRAWDPEDVAVMREERRPMVTFNVAGKYIDAVTGLQVNNRQEITYSPRQPGRIGPDELLNAAVSWARDECDADDEESEAFYDLALTGMGWAECFVRKDTPERMPADERRDPLEMFWDPTARKRNLEDARWVARLIPYTKERFAEDFGKDTDAVGEPSADVDPLAGTPQIIQTPHDYADTDEASIPKADVWVADYQWCVSERAFDVTAEGLGNRIFDAEEWAAVEPMLVRSARAYAVEPTSRMRYYRAYLNGQRVLKKMIGAYQDGFTYRCMTGKRDRNKATWYGLGRAIRDPQAWTNKFFSSLIHTLASNPKGGLMIERSATPDQRKLEESWANPSSVTVLEDGAISGGKVQPKPATVYPTGMDRLMEFSMNALPQTTGLNTELMGLADRDQAAILEAQRKQSAMAVIAWAFASMRRFHIGVGRIYASFVRDFMPDQTLIRLAAPEGEQYVPLVRDKLAARYDVQVDEAPTSTNMKERAWSAIERLVPALLKAGIRIPPSVIDYAPLPKSLVDDWKKVSEPDPQQQQMAQASAQLELAAKQAEIERDKSAALLNQAKAQAEGAPKGDDGADQLQHAMDLRFQAMQNALDRMLEAQRAQAEIESRERIAALQAATALENAEKAARRATQAAEQAASKADAIEGAKRENEANSGRQAEALAAAMGRLAEAMGALRAPMKVNRDEAGNITTLQ